VHPRPFEYTRPETLTEALEVLRSTDGEARPIAGGQSLVPMMSLGLATPDLVVDLARLPLMGLESGNGRVKLGALTRHREIERSSELAALLPLASEAAGYIGNPRVRNRGTLGGSLSHADPASELGAVALVHGGSVVIAGPEGERAVPISGFFHGLFTTEVGPGELLARVELELPPAGSGHGFHEVANRADDFATAAAAAVVTVDERGACAEARLALAGVADRPVRLERAEQLSRGEALEEDVLETVARTVVEDVEPEGDAFTSARYRAQAAGTCAARALGAAWRRARR
jgi:aerobic carbon-monoxide dehydrogenase medium subunit